jgi:hypothetical protein
VEINIVKKTCGILFALALVWSAGASAAETGPVREFYACSLLEGKTMDDVMEIRDELAKQIEKTGNADLSNRVSILWTPVKTDQQIDFLWFDLHESLNAMGRAEAAFVASGGSAVINGMAAETVRCGAGIVTHEQIYAGPSQLDGQGAVVVESYRCNLRPGKSVADAAEVVEDWAKVIDGLDGFDTFQGYMQTPVISSAPSDLYYFLVHADIAEFAARTTAYRTSKGGMAVDARFNDVHRCDSALWNGEVVIGSLQ